MKNREIQQLKFGKKISYTGKRPTELPYLVGSVHLIKASLYQVVVRLHNGCLLYVFSEGEEEAFLTLDIVLKVNKKIPL